MTDLVQETFTHRDTEMDLLSMVPNLYPQCNYGAGHGNVSPSSIQGSESKERMRKCSVVRKEISSHQGQEAEGRLETRASV